MLSRRRFLAWLLGLVLTTSWAFAEESEDEKKRQEQKKQEEEKKREDEKKKEEEKKKKEEEKKKEEDKKSGNNSNKSNSTNKPHALYDEVNLARNGVVLLSSGRLVSDSPWTPFLASGMWIKAEGTWDNDTFNASSVQISDPAYFSYYRGPGAPLGLGNGWVEAWYSAQGPTAPLQQMLVQAVNVGGDILLLAKASAGRMQAIPDGLPEVPNLPQGWVLAKGELQNGLIHWKGSSLLP